MNSLFHAYCAAVISKTRCLVGGRSICRFSAFPWRASCCQPGIRSVNLNSSFERVLIRPYSTKKSRKKSSRLQKSNYASESAPALILNKEKDAFFLVRKGDLVGIYKNLNDYQNQVGSSLNDPPVNVYKGYAMPKNTEDYLISHGLKNALFSISVQHVTEDLFGTLLLLPFQDAVGPTVRPDGSLKEHAAKSENDFDQAIPLGCSCTIEFDGSSKRNGRAGAGVVIRADNGSLTYRLREGLGIATCNVAEYRAFILGLKYALSKGFTSIRVQGDSKLVCMQIEGRWKVRSTNLTVVYGEAKELKEKFFSFQINHVLRGSNSDADKQANLGAALPDGLIEVEIEN